ncbi:MAG: hypothetical protein GXO40_03960 [Epsilonproteobacteria bacterium]|nr:hypothetical protein [Campylobacterota bacterium]
MRLEDDVLYINEEIEDERVEEFIASVSQDNISKIVVETPHLGGSIVQVLLIKKRDVEVEVEDETLAKLFENVLYKRIE